MATKVTASQPSYKDGMLRIELAAVLEDKSKQTGEVEADFEELLPWAIAAPKEALDIFMLASIIYGTDRFIPRHENSIDGWSRELVLTVPVYQVKKWKAAAGELEKLLSFLTGDYWKVNFRKNKFSIPESSQIQLFQPSITHVSLFSGGLDSLVGAINLLDGNNNNSLFISHYDSMMKGPKHDQSDLRRELINKYGERFQHLPSIRVSLSETSFSKTETSSRSRSFLFIGLALLPAVVKNVDIFVPENGTVSVNYPLSPSRRGSCSTRTTHPSFIHYLSGIFKALGIATKIQNPFSLMTKGEMTNACSNKSFLASIITQSNSCGKRGHRAHWIRKGSHCGICMPCIYRRAALLNFTDTTRYGNMVNELPPFKSKKSQDVGALLEFLHTPVTSTDIKFELISNGLQDHIALPDYVDLVNRTRIELSDWVRKNGNKEVREKAGL
jgi:7-cyano-7-deazaguanine synthase in queuosine biosynthesis